MIQQPEVVPQPPSDAQQQQQEAQQQQQQQPVPPPSEQLVTSLLSATTAMATTVEEESVFVPLGGCGCGGRKRKCECTHPSNPNPDSQSDSDEEDYVDYVEVQIVSDDDDDVKEFEKQFSIYSQQVRESDGFHVDNFPAVRGIHPLEIEDKDLYKDLKKLTEMAIEQYNEKQNANLEFVDLVRANLEGVAGFRYYITFVAMDSSGETRNYQALVWDGVRETVVQLFRPEPIKQGDPKKSRLHVPHGV